MLRRGGPSAGKAEGVKLCGVLGAESVTSMRPYNPSISIHGTQKGSVLHGALKVTSLYRQHGARPSRATSRLCTRGGLSKHHKPAEGWRQQQQQQHKLESERQF